MIIQPGPEPNYGISLPFPGNQFPEATISCPDQDPLTGPFPGPPQMIYTENPQQTMVRGSYQGSTHFNASGFTWSYTWNLTDP